MNQQIAQKIFNIIPKLNSQSKKGDNGRIGVIGGSFQYTGAPFYSAITSLKTGADLSHIFCSKSAAIPIKSYSPEIIVHPVFALSQQQQKKLSQSQLDQASDEWLKKIKHWQKAIDVWVIGPGLGRDKYIDALFVKIVKNLQKNSILIFDADGIFYLCKFPELFQFLKNYRVILTPNVRQFKHLKQILNLNLQQILQKQNEPPKLLNYNHTFNIMIKGQYDIYLTPQKAYQIKIQGGFKRSGGIGDVLSGAIATCAKWNFEYGPILGSWIVKKATRKAFEKEGRAMSPNSIIQVIGQSFRQIEQELQKKF